MSYPKIHHAYFALSVALTLGVATWFAASPVFGAAQPPAGTTAAVPASPTPKAKAYIDITGYWVWMA